MVQIDSDGLGIEHNLYHRGDTDTKLSFPAANTITAITGGTERLRIDSTGRVMIATTVAGTNSDLTIGDASSGSTGRIRIRSASNGGGYIDFQDTTGSTVDGSIEYNHILNSFNFYFESQERFRIHTQGMLGLSGANYGTSGQVLTSGGTGNPVSWTTITGTTINNNANNRVITGSGTANTLEAESELTYSGGTFQMSANSPQFMITESDTTTSSRLVMSGGVFYIQTAQSGQGSSTSSGIMYLTGYNNTTASEIHLKANNTYNTGHFHLEDDYYLKIGASDDFQIYHSTDNYIKSVGSSQNLIFDVNSSERLRITSAGDVGIGYNSPTVKLHVRQGASGASSYDNRYHMICENSGEAYLGFYVPDNSFAGIRFADTTGNEGYLDYYFNTDEMVYYSTAIHRWSTNGSERLRIDSSGRVGINKTPALASSKLEVGGADNYPLINVEASGATAGVGIGGGALQFFYGTSEKARITSAGYIRLGNLGYSTSKVGGQAVTAQDFDPYLKLYASTNNHWLMQLRSDTATGGNGIFLRSSNSSSNYSMFVTGYDESNPHIVARGDSRVGIATTNPRTTLHVEGSISGGTINQPFQRQFSKTHNHQRETKHYFRCVGGNQTYDIITVDLNSNFHQAVCEVLYGTRLQNISDSQTQPNKIIFGINRFLGNTPSIHKQVLYQHTNAANHADVNIVATSSSQYRVRIVMSSSCGGSSFCGGYVELIAVGSGSDGSFYSLSHSHGLLD